MANLGQTIVNRVKPLLDEVNSAGYRAGYLNGEQSGYDQGHSDGYEQGKQDGASIGDAEAYEEGYNAGYDVGYVMGNSDGYDNGYSDSSAEFWASMLDYGTRTNFATAFAGIGWNDKTFRPTYDMTPSGSKSASAVSMFNACRITDLAGILSSLGSKIDFSQASSLKYCFSNSTITHLPLLDISSAETIESLCSGCTELEKIEGIHLSERIVQTFPTAFRNCYALKHIRWSGGSIKTDLDLSAATQLDRASISNTIKALHSFQKEATTDDYFNDVSTPILIKLQDVPENVTECVARIDHTVVTFDYDPETGEEIENTYVEEEIAYFNDNGEVVFFPMDYPGSCVKSVEDNTGKPLPFTLHYGESYYDEPSYSPTVTFSADAIKKAFETRDGANDGLRSHEWNVLEYSRPSATVSLIY